MFGGAEGLRQPPRNDPPCISRSSCGRLRVRRRPGLLTYPTVVMPNWLIRDSYKLRNAPSFPCQSAHKSPDSWSHGQL